ncbi:endonuclease VIII [Halioglobus maricola]|uniref:DNA-(apurinic or apyrimidinic site) lyase n=1 Tax=Halioglobus maricola TaxID=2601894 RepID=A0A5P9NF53_9GAMM|nr:endonuclease VIII [Halioglobus maricola]QFU74390.1 endonuclease VIII [Halioglobus maricola]
MPEGPEIRRAADEIAQVLEGRVVERVSFAHPPLRHHGKRFKGRRVEHVETRGKALLTHFDHGWTIYSHNQLYGVWHVAKRGSLPDTKRSLRLRLTTASHEALLYSASEISVWRTDELDQHPFLSRLGPDILNENLEWRTITALLEEPRFAGRQLGALYLDQTFLAGLGNYLRSEILFAAGLHPSMTPSELTRGQLGRLARSTLDLSRRSYLTGGITNPPARARKLEAADASFGQRRFAVFEREGLACYECGVRIERIDISTRRLYLCKQCQQAPNAGARQRGL